ncbi:FDXHR family putative zinc-binding protein [Rhodococcus erythropolis]
MNTSHCSACHHTFSAIGTFDRHRRNNQCLTPEEAGFVRNAHGYWGSQGDGTWWSAE